MFLVANSRLLLVFSVKDWTNSLILEHAPLDVRSGSESEFEHAFSQARKIIESMPGFLGLRLLRCIEQSSKYLLIVEWRTLEDHTEGFRKSPSYQSWRDLLHHFYDPFPTVLHFIDTDQV